MKRKEIEKIIILVIPPNSFMYYFTIDGTENRPVCHV